MAIKQKYLGDRSMLVVLALLSSFPPLSTDLYLPALPQMVKAFSTTQAHLNLTLSLFFICFALAILFWGPLSEKYGRKPILFTGLVIYSLASVICSMASDVNYLIMARAFQAIGGGASTAVSTAIVKDSFTGRKREKAIAIIMSMVIAAPVVAPLVGSFLLKIASWRAIFWMLTGMGILAILVAIPLQETLENRYEGHPLKSLGRLGVVMKNPGFSSLLIIFSMAPMAVMGFVSASSYIYIREFGLSEQGFGMLFALNSLCAMAGPFLYVRISDSLPVSRIITVSYIVVTLCGFIMLVTGSFHYMVFAFTMAPATLASMAIRPPAVNLMLDQQEYDSGSASALINCMGMVMGSFGIFLVSGATGSLIPVLGILLSITGALGGLSWVWVRNRSFVRNIS